MNQVAPRDYSFIAPIYDRVFNKALSEGHSKIGRLMRKRMPKGRISKVLEVGVGTGLTFTQVPATVDFVGIDINEKMLLMAKEKAQRLGKKKIRLEMMDAVKMSFASNSFDLVLAPSVLSAMDQPEKGLKEMIRVTKKGGKIALILNLRQKGSKSSELMRIFDPITRKYFGFRLDLTLEDLQKFKNLRLVEKRNVNSLFGLPLSTFVLFEKI